jgi:hypothetical protein
MLFQTSNLSELQKADKSNTEFCQGIIKGKIKSVQVYQIPNGKVNKKTKTIANFDQAGNLTEFISNNEVRHEFVYKNKKLVRESFYSPTAPNTPYNDTYYTYNEEGVLVESKTDSRKKNFIYEKGKLLKTQEFIDNELLNSSTYIYSICSEQILMKDPKGNLLRTSVKTYFPAGNKVTHVITDHKINHKTDTQTTYDLHGDEIDFESASSLRKTKYMKYDSLGNWTSKVMYQNKDTLIVHRILKFY